MPCRWVCRRSYTHAHAVPHRGAPPHACLVICPSSCLLPPAVCAAQVTDLVLVKRPATAPWTLTDVEKGLLARQYTRVELATMQSGKLGVSETSYSGACLDSASNDDPDLDEDWIKLFLDARAGRQQALPTEQKLAIKNFCVSKQHRRPARP